MRSLVLGRGHLVGRRGCRPQKNNPEVRISRAFTGSWQRAPTESGPERPNFRQTTLFGVLRQNFWDREGVSRREDLALGLRSGALCRSRATMGGRIVTVPRMAREIICDVEPADPLRLVYVCAWLH